LGRPGADVELDAVIHAGGGNTIAIQIQKLWAAAPSPCAHNPPRDATCIHSGALQ